METLHLRVGSPSSLPSREFAEMISISNNVSGETYPLLSGFSEIFINRCKRRIIRNSIAALVELSLADSNPIK